VKHRIQRGKPTVLNIGTVKALFSYLERSEPDLVPYFALATFAGIRTGGELEKLAKRADADNLIDLENRVIHIEPEIAKTGQYRQITICGALAAFLTRYEGSVYPLGYSSRATPARMSCPQRSCP